MAPKPEIYDETATVLIEPDSSLPLSIGPSVLSSVPVLQWVYNDKSGAANADLLKDAWFGIRVWDGADWVTSGFPIVDEFWVRLRLVDLDSTGDSAMQPQVTPGWQPVGAGRPFLLKDIPRMCGRKFEVQIVMPSGATNNTQRTELVLIYDQNVIPLALLVSFPTGGGVIPEHYDFTQSALLSGSEVTADGTATVALLRGIYAAGGNSHVGLPFTTVLNLQDVNAAALAPGEFYYAMIVRRNGNGVVVKGIKGVAPARPAPAAGDLICAEIVVNYQAGGVAVITTANIDRSRVYYAGYHVEAGVGRSVKVWGGRAVTSGDTLTYHSNFTVIGDLPANFGSIAIWLMPDGSRIWFPGIPDPGAELLAYATTNATNVTAVNEAVRKYAHRSVDVLTVALFYAGPPAPGTDLAYAFVPLGDWDVECVEARFGRAGAGGSGSFKIDVNRRAGPYATLDALFPETFFTAQATFDYRPTIAAGQTHSPREYHHQRRFLTGGDLLSMDIDTVASGMSTDPQDVWVFIHLRRRG